MKYGLQALTTPELPVSVQEACTYVRADLEAEGYDIGQLLEHAREEVERYTGRALLSTDYRLLLSDWPRGASEFASYPRRPEGGYISTLELPRTPVTAISSVKYFANGSDVLTTLSPTTYIAVTAYEPGMVYLKEGNTWPELAERPDAVQVEFTAGYTLETFPRSLKQAMLLLVRYYYAGGSPNPRDEVADDLAKTHLLLDKYRISGWSA